MSIALISDPACKLHKMGDHHPEQPARLDAINNRLIASGLEMVLLNYDAPEVTREQLLAVHDESYIDLVFDSSPSEGLVWLDGDTAMNPHTLQAALHAAGAAVLGVDLVMQGKASQVFCSVRPPGHHAEHNKAMGFCFFNNVAVGALHAINEYGLKRVLIVDFDVHHGNGTEDIVAGDERILFCSSFQHPYYPGPGFSTNTPNVLNLPLPSLTDGKAFREAVIEAWLPKIEAFKPELIMISAGFDGHREDEMAHFNLLEFDYAWITRQLSQFATMSAKGRIVSCLEGGYELHSLARSVEAHIKAFM
ncbi:MAG: histone deacetylase family protein [Gammaproteobacteria bacterium]|nr:histone deacetylase family protein [Gammaproteobacteria bacterium]MBL6999482.1 histone deacetylase family protein [Gammaproteobacteria bacterium]